MERLLYSSFNSWIDKKDIVINNELFHLTVIVKTK